VSSHNEWDPLEEVIVGILEGAAVLPWEAALYAVTPKEHLERARAYHLAHGGEPIPPIFVNAAERELAELVSILEGEGVKVRRPDPIDHARPHQTPDFVSLGGNCQANPRDVLLVLGDEIIEAPMAWRSRYFEYRAYRRLIREYVAAGARWTAAPKPSMGNALYDWDFVRGKSYVTTEHEPCWDAADVARCGRDLFVQRSHVTNLAGIDWLARHVGDRYRVHTVEFADERAIHIDATFVPLAPGKLLVNPDRPIKAMPAVVREGRWEVREAPRSTLPESHPWYWSFRWLSMNVLSLDERRIIVEASEGPTIAFLREWGFDPIPCPFRQNYKYGGSFHCATVDVRRRGSLEDHFR